MFSPTQLVDLQRYPICSLDTVENQQQLSLWHRQFVDNGVCVLEGFVRQDELVHMVVEANELAPLGYHNTVTGNAYLDRIDETLPAEHPKRRTETTSLAAVACDQIPEHARIKVLYQWHALTEFIRAVAGLDQLYQYDCPLGALNLSVMIDYDYLRWHFDQSDFVVSIPLQESESGGVFEFAKNLRSPKNENFERVSRVIDGDRSDVQTLLAPAGSLILFKGKNTLHRVTRVEGNRPRLYALLGYAEQPHVRGSDYLNMIRYGRTVPVDSSTVLECMVRPRQTCTSGDRDTSAPERLPSIAALRGMPVAQFSPGHARFGEQTSKAVQTHSYSQRVLSEYPLLIKALISVKWAAAQANLQAGVLSEDHCLSIAGACEQLMTMDFRDAFVVDVLQGGGGIAINVNVNEVISRLSRVPWQLVNASQSTADVCATATRISLWELSQGTCQRLRQLESSLRGRAEQFQHIRTIGRTCLRDASQTSLGETFRAFAELIHRREERLRSALQLMLKVNLGGTVIGSGEGAPPCFAALAIEKLKLRCPYPLELRPNLYDAAQNADDLGEVSHQLALLAETLIKQCQDLRLLSSGPNAGFGEINLPRIMVGSSFFEDKSNPTVVETLLQCCFVALGRHRTVQACLEHAELQLNVFESLAGISIYEVLQMFERCLQHFDEHCIQGITANLSRCESLAAYAAQSVSFNELSSSSQRQSPSV